MILVVDQCHPYSSLVSQIPTFSTLTLITLSQVRSPLLFIDHLIKKALIEKEKEEYTRLDFQSFHTDVIRSIPAEQLDPSMLLAFFFASSQDYESFKQEYKDVYSGSTPLFEILEKEPDWEDGPDVLSDSE